MPTHQDFGVRVTASFVDRENASFEFDTRYEVCLVVYGPGRPPSTVNIMFRVVQLYSTCFFHTVGILMKQMYTPDHLNEIMSITS